MRTGIFVAALACAVFAQTSDADYVYVVEALPGQLQGSTISGQFVLPDSAVGLTDWALGATAIDHHIETSLFPGTPFETIFFSMPIHFDNGIGAPVLTPVLPDVSLGFPDIVFRSASLFNRSLMLGIDAAGKTVWSVVDPQIGGNLDENVQLDGSTTPAWRLVLDAPLPGDLDGDGFVGINDLNIVLGNWNQSVPPADPLADPSGDGFVGIDDLNMVLGNWNAGVPPQADTGAIPEPSTAAAIALLSLLVSSGGRYNRPSRS